jgi:hypothetical protein
MAFNAADRSFRHADLKKRRPPLRHRNNLLDEHEQATSGAGLRPATMPPSAYGGRDEKALQSRR